VRAKGLYRIQFDFEFEGVRYRPTVLRRPTDANIARAQKQQEDIKARIARGTFNFAEEFPDFRFKHKLIASPERERTCNEVFDAFLAHCESRMRMKDLAFATYNGYRKLLAQIWRPKIGDRPFLHVRYSELIGVVSAYPWSKKTYNNAVSTVRCAFDFGFPSAMEREPCQTRSSTTGPLPRPPHLGNVATDDREESALGRQAARSQRASDAHDVCGVARGYDECGYRGDQSSDAKSRRANDFTARGSCACGPQGSPAAPRIWHSFGTRKGEA
jgi:hypothetical protein